MKRFIKNKLRERLITEGDSEVARVTKLLNSLEFKNDVLRAGGSIYAVGGIVRDALMNKPSDDLDIVVRGVSYENLFRILKRFGSPTDTSTNKEDKDFGATKFVSSSAAFNELLAKNGVDKVIDVMLPRKDAKDPNVKGHRGIQSDVNHTYTIEDDLERRDITINAIALGLDGKTIDKGGQGQKDMQTGTIRAVSKDSFLEDPLRMLRAVRFRNRFDFDMDPATLNLIKQNVDLLSDKGELPAERFLMEFEKMIGKTDLGKAVKQLVELGMYKAIFGVESKIRDFNKFDRAKSLDEFAYMMFEEQPPNTILNLVFNNITQEKSVIAYVKALVRYVNEVKGKSLETVKDKVSEIYNNSPAMMLNSTYVDEEHRKFAKEFESGDTPKEAKAIAFKGTEFSDFIETTVAEVQGRYNQKMDAPKMGKAKRVALQAIYDGIITNDVDEIKKFLLSNKDMWII